MVAAPAKKAERDGASREVARAATTRKRPYAAGTEARLSRAMRRLEHIPPLRKPGRYFPAQSLASHRAARTDARRRRDGGAYVDGDAENFETSGSLRISLPRQRPKWW